VHVRLQGCFRACAVTDGRDVALHNCALVGCAKRVVCIPNAPNPSHPARPHLRARSTASHNSLSGSMPEWSTLSALQRLDLQFNALTVLPDTYPAYLTSLLLNNNGGSGRAPLAHCAAPLHPSAVWCGRFLIAATEGMCLPFRVVMPSPTCTISDCDTHPLPHKLSRTPPLSHSQSFKSWRRRCFICNTFEHCE
jgi:hypothetical protein